jgi:uncharacterized protein (DUF2235 family)
MFGVGLGHNIREAYEFLSMVAFTIAAAHS